MTAFDGNLYLSGWSGLTYTDIQTFNGKTIPSANQTSVNNLIKSVEDYIERECARNFKVLATDDYYSEIFTSGKTSYQLSSYPITLKKIILNSQTVYDSSSQTNIYTLNLDFYIKHNRIYFPGTAEASGYYNDLEFRYNISQFWGDDVKQAIIRVVSDIYLNRANSGKPITNMSFSGVSFGFLQDETTRMMKDIISYYRIPIL